MTNLKTQEQLRNLMTGIEPIRRTNRRAGESEYYFLRPVADSEYDDEQIDVPDGVDPIAFRDAGYQVPITSGFGTSGFNLNQINSSMLELLINGQFNAGLGFNRIKGGVNAYKNGNRDYIIDAYKNQNIQPERGGHYVELGCRGMSDFD